MKSKVYFTAVTGNLASLLQESKVVDFIRKEDRVAIKAHFGEQGNTGYVRPECMRVVCDAVAAKSARAFLSDANTLYRGRRLTSDDHLALAREHGFSKESMGVEVIIPDDAKKENVLDIEIGQKNIKSAKIARLYVEAEAIVAVSHFKGHILTGFGGAIKNIGMGCATREGKLAQHCDVSPVVHSEKCTGCAACQKVCPAGAIQIENKKSVITKSKCIGCASCIAACPTMAMFIDFGGGAKVSEKMAEYTLAVLKNKKNKAGFINFAVRINRECDCWSMENPRIAPDVGIFASLDPVSVDKASFDMVNQACGKDVFKETHPDSDALKQLKYAQSLGLGSLDYELVTI